MVFRCCFNLCLHFSGDLQREAFHMLICHVYIFFGEVSVDVTGPFSNWVVCFIIVNV